MGTVLLDRGKDLGILEQQQHDGTLWRQRDPKVCSTITSAYQCLELHDWHDTRVNCRRLATVTYMMETARAAKPQIHGESLTPTMSMDVTMQGCDLPSKKQGAFCGEGQKWPSGPDDRVGVGSLGILRCLQFRLSAKVLCREKGILYIRYYRAGQSSTHTCPFTLKGILSHKAGLKYSTTSSRRFYQLDTGKLWKGAANRSIFAPDSSHTHDPVPSENI